MSRALLSLLLLTAVSSPTPTAVTDLLARLTAARQRVAYSGEQLVVTSAQGRTHVALVRVEHDPAAGTRLSYRPLTGGGQRRVVIHTPSRTVEYEPRTRRGRTYRPYDLGVPLSQHVDRVLQNYTLSTHPSRALGRPAVRIRVWPRLAGRPRADLRVDLQTGVVLRSERISADGRAREFSAFLTFTPRPVGWMGRIQLPRDLRLQHELPPELMPADRLERLFGEPLPAFRPPAGFQPSTEFLLDRSGPVVRRAYSDGLATLLLSLRPGRIPRPPTGSRVVQRPGGPVWVQPAGLRTLAYWTQEGWSITVVAELSPEVLVEVADRTGISGAPSLFDGIVDWFRRTLGLGDEL